MSDAQQAEIPQRIKVVKDEIVPLYPDECEPHTPDPDGYLQWHAWAERMAATHVQRQCKGCGLWAIWEPKADTGSPSETDSRSVNPDAATAAGEENQ